MERAPGSFVKTLPGAATEETRASEFDRPSGVHLRRTGQVLNERYRIEGLSGEGSVGLVYRATDLRLGRPVAIKLLREEHAHGEILERFFREARVLSRMAHPNVISVHDLGKAGRDVFVAMELVEGGTLRDWLDGGARSRREILEAFLQAGHGLAAAHAAGLVHRDFKPENVLVGNDGRVRVTDFGLAHPTEAPSP
jgi:serine/threonine protein kinase